MSDTHSFLPLLSFSHPLILLFEWSSFATSRRSPVWFAQALQAHSTTTTRSISLPNCSVERTPPLMSFTSALRTSSALLCKEALGNGNPNPLWTGFYCSLKCDFRCRYRRWANEGGGKFFNGVSALCSGLLGDAASCEPCGLCVDRLDQHCCCVGQ